MLLERVSGFLEVLEARESRDENRLFEASLGRLWQHFQKSDKTSFGIVTSWKDIDPKLPHEVQNQKMEENIRNYKELKRLIRSWKLGFVELAGKWYRCSCREGGGGCEGCPDDQKVYEVVNEPSLFVPGLTKDQADHIRAAFNQDAVLWGGPEVFTKGHGAKLLTKDQGEEIPLGPMVPGKTADIYSTVRGRPFTFEWVAQTPEERIMERVWSQK